MRSSADGGPTYTPTDNDLGKHLLVEAHEHYWVADGVQAPLTIEADTDLGVVGAGLYVVQQPMITGEAIAGAELTVDPGTWAGASGASKAYSYVWERCDEHGDDCASVGGADSDTYTTTSADIGYRFRAIVTAFIGGHVEAGVAGRTALTDAIAAGAAPANFEVPTITGTPAQHEMLIAHAGAWTGAPTPTLTYQWESCDADAAHCSVIDGASGSDYQPDTTVRGRHLRVVETATNATGTAHRASELTEAISDGRAPTVRAVPTLALLGPSGPGSTLVTDGGEWSDADGGVHVYNWQRCDSTGANCEEIPNDGSRVYGLETEDVGHRIQVTADVVTDAGVASAVSDLSDVIGNSETSADDRVALVDKTRHELRTMARDGSDGQTITTCTGLGADGDCNLQTPRISPSLKMVALQAWSSTDGDGVYVVNVDGSGARRLASGTSPTWSPDGATIVFAGTDGQLQEADATGHADPQPLDAQDGGGSNPTAPPLRTLSAPDDADTDPAISSDGHVAFVRRSTSGSAAPRLYVASRLGGSPRRIDLSSRFIDIRDVRFTEDETALTFTAALGDEQDIGTSIWRIRLDGSGLRRLTPRDRHTYERGEADDATLVATRAVYRSCGSPSLAAAVVAPLVSLGCGDVDQPRTCLISVDDGSMHCLDVAGLDAELAHKIHIPLPHIHIDWDTLLNGPTFTEIDGTLVPVYQNGIAGEFVETVVRKIFGLGKAAYQAAKDRAEMVGLSVRLLLGAERFAAGRVGELWKLVPQSERRYKTLAVGVGKNNKGELRVVVGTSEKYGILRKPVYAAVKKQSEEIALGYEGHAEIQILQYMRDTGLRPITIGASNKICPACARAIADAKATPATPIK